MAATKNINLDEKYVLTSTTQRKLITTIIVGVALLAFGAFGLSQGWFDPATSSDHNAEHHGAIVQASKLLASEGHSDAISQEQSEHAAAGHHAYHWSKRIVMNAWLNNVWFLGIAIIGIFFLTVNYISWAGWNAGFKRVLEAFGYYIPVAGVITLLLYVFFKHDIFHWSHEGIMVEGSANYDAIIAGKKWWLGEGFFIFRLVFYFVAWFGVFYMIRKASLLEDVVGGDENHQKMVTWSGLFVWIFGITTSTGAWDLVMSIDTHWFSTLFGWYTFSSWLVSGMCVITLLVIYLKEAGYLSIVNDEHLHDLGTYVFGFSIFWTYLWFSQYILYWYANIPEEGIWFIERFFNNNGNYLSLVIFNLVINFLFPFLYFMTREAKRTATILKVGSFVILFGHWVDFYLMVMPGTLGEHGGLNLGMVFVEFGTTLIFTGIFLYVILHFLSKAPLIPKNHPMLQESINHHT